MQGKKRFTIGLTELRRHVLREEAAVLCSLAENDSPYDVLTLTADYGAGHRRASQALEQAFQEIRPDIKVLTLNYIQFVHPLLDRITRSLYVNTVRLAPELYRRFYYITESIDPDSIWQLALNSFGHRRLLRLVQKVKPKVAVCTFPTPAGVLGELKRRGQVCLPLVTVITDNAVHTQWLSPSTDLYLVASDYVKDSLLEKGILADRMVVTGIPIDRGFGSELDATALREKHGLLKDLPVVLLLGSAYGMTPDAWKTAEWLGSLDVPCQIIVVAGKDQNLYNQCQELSGRCKNRVLVLGYVNNMHELMALSDLAVTKAGGLTVSEALSMSLQQTNLDFPSSIGFLITIKAA